MAVYAAIIGLELKLFVILSTRRGHVMWTRQMLGPKVEFANKKGDDSNLNTTTTMPVPATAPNTPVRNIRYSVPVTPRTPLTSPSSPYTPLSTRYSSPFSFAYASSNATTPGSAYSAAGVKKLVSTRGKADDGPERERSLADIADNWRSRACENGIRVSCSEGERDADDEGTCFFLNSFYFVLFLIMETASDSSKGKRAYMRAF
jgi:hypothetical protein